MPRALGGAVVEVSATTETAGTAAEVERERQLEQCTVDRESDDGDSVPSVNASGLLNRNAAISTTLSVWRNLDASTSGSEGTHGSTTGDPDESTQDASACRPNGANATALRPPNVGMSTMVQTEVCIGARALATPGM